MSELSSEDYEKAKELIEPIITNITNQLVPMLNSVSKLLGTILVDGGYIDLDGNITEKGRQLLEEYKTSE